MLTIDIEDNVGVVATNLIELPVSDEKILRFNKGSLRQGKSKSARGYGIKKTHWGCISWLSLSIETINILA